MGGAPSLRSGRGHSAEEQQRRLGQAYERDARGRCGIVEDDGDRMVDLATCQERDSGHGGAWAAGLRHDGRGDL